MRISGIDKYLGGANNVKAIDFIRGEQRTYSGTVTDPDNNNAVVDLTNATLTGVAEFYHADVTIEGKNLTVTDFVKPTSPAIADKAISLTKDVDPTTGKVTFVIPKDLATSTDTAAINAATSVLIAVIFLEYDLGVNVLKHRVLVVIRHAP